jgi:protein-disulfide isomerase
MNIKRLTFWIIFVLILGLIVWGLYAAMNKSPSSLPKVGVPAPVTATDHILGPVDAPVTLIEYSDFQCPACELYYSMVKQLVNESSTTMRLVYRHFPLDEVLPGGQVQHPNADAAAEASEAAGAQGKFWEMYDLLFANHTDWTELPDPTAVFVGYATKIGLNVDQFKKDLVSQPIRDVVQADKSEGVSLGINQTPTFFVNGKAIVNPQSYEAFKALIDSAAR